MFSSSSVLAIDLSCGTTFRISDLGNTISCAMPSSMRVLALVNHVT